MGNPYDISDDDPEYQALLKQYGVGGPKPAKQNSGFAGDVGTGLKIGVEQLPGMVTGLADIAVAPISKMTGLNKPFSKGADWLGEQTGFQPEAWAKKAQSEYSPQYQEAKHNVDAAEGFWGTTGALLKNPRVVAGTVAESLPSTVAGMGVAGFGARAALGAERFAALRTAAAAGDKAALGQLTKYGSIAGGIGEGAVTAGQQMSQLGDNVDPLVAAGTSLGAGTVTGVIGGMSGRLASKMGLSDIDSALVTGIGNKTGQAGIGGIAKRAAQGALTEGVIEELPQSMQEQIWQNVAEGKPWNEGVAKQGAMGMLAGMAMGAGINMAPRREPQPVETPLAEEKAPVNLLGHNPEIGTSWNNTYNNDPIIAEGSASQVPLQQLDLLHLGDQMTEARELMHSDMSQRRQDALYDMPEFNLNDQTLPLPTDPGSAVAVIQVLSHAAERGQALVEGTAAHEALVEAQRILAENGLSFISAKAPTIAKGASNAVSQVAQGSNQVQGSNSVRSTGTVGLGNSATDQRDGVGRTAVAPAGPGGTTGVVGSTSGGVSAVNPATAGFGSKQKSLWADAISKLGEDHPALESINQTITSGKLAQASKEIEQAAKPKDARTLSEKLLASLPNGRKGKVAKGGIDYAGVLSTFVGFDGNNDEKLEAVAKAHGYQDRQRAHQIIYGYTAAKGKHVPGAIERLKDLALKNGYSAEEAKRAILDLGFARNDQYGLSEDQKEIASLTGALETGIESPNQGSLDFADAEQQGMLSRELQANPVTDSAGESEGIGGSSIINEQSRLAAEQALDKATAEELDPNASKVKGTPDERGLTVEEIKAKRAAETQAKADAKGGTLEEAKPREATAAPKYEHDPEVVEKAAMFWNERQEDVGGARFEDVPESIREKFVQLVLDELKHPSNHVNFTRLDKQQEYLNYEHEVDQRRSVERPEQRVTKQADESIQRASSGKQGTAKAEEVVQPVSSESSSEEVTADGIVSKWNQGAKALGVTAWDGLSSEQKNYILGSGTWEEFDEAAQEVLDEINDDQGAAKFSEGKTDQGIEPQKLAATLRKYFFSPEKFNKLVSIFPNAEAIPADVKAAAAADAHMSVNDVPWEEVQGFAMNGKVYLVASNIKEGNELGVFLHELGVHVGMERLIGKSNMVKLSSQIEQWAAKDDGSKESKLAKDAVRRAEGSASEDQQQEVIAYFVEEAVKAGINPVAVQKTNSPLAQWFRSLWAAAKLALRKIGFGRFDQLTAQNIVDLSYGAAKMELTGTWHGTAADFRNFNHSYMGSGEGAQAFGWGTYLAQRVGIAKGYWEADVRRKKNGGSDYAQVELDGVPLKEFFGIDTDAFYFDQMDELQAMSPEKLKEHVLLQVRRESRGMYGINSNPQLEAVAERIERTDPSMFAVVQNQQVEGSLMRVDTAVHDDEMLDLDKAVSKQSEQVKAALTKVKATIDPEFLDEELDRLNADWDELTGGELIMYSGQPGVLTRYAEAGGLYYQYLVELGDQRSDAKTKEAYNNGMLTPEEYAGKENFERVNKMSPEVVVAHYLDSIGIKGIKFLDSQSRSPSAAGGNATLNDVGLDSLAGPVDHYGKEKTIPTNAKLKTRGNTIYVQLQNGVLPDFVAIDTLSRDGMELLDDQGKLDALFAIKKFVPNQTRNLVIFNDKNIQRVASQVGANRDKVKFSQADITDQAQRIAGETGKQLVDDTSHFLKKLGRGMEFLNDLIDRAKNVLPSAGTWYSAFQKMQASKIQMERKAEEVASLADTLGAERYKVVNDFIGDSTFKQQWGFQPSWKQEKVTVDSTMAVRWAKLSAEEKALIEAVFKHGDEFIAQRDAIFKKLGIEDKMLTTSRIQGPYAPLKRFGNYVAVLKSKELVAAEKLVATSPNAENNKRVDELKKDPDHFVSKQFDTIGQARKYSKANAADWAFTDSFESSTNVDDRTTMDYQVLQKVMGSLNATNLPATVRTEMENTIRDIYISSVDEHSARISGLKRKNRAGYDEDMLRSFLVNARANASFLANLEHGTEMNDAFYKMQNETKDADGRRGGQDMFNSIAEHYKMNLHYEETPIADRLTAFTSAWQLSSSVGYHVTNASQGMMVSVPWLAAQFNDYRGAWRHLMGGYATMREIIKGKTGYDGIDLSKVKNPKLREALEHAYNMNLLDVGMQEDLSHFDRFRSGYSAVDSASGVVSSVMHKLRRVASMVELWNRVSSATAAYNMAIEKGKSHEQALAYVEGVLRKTQGDFTRADAPLLLKKLPKPTVQYRKYQFLMGAFYVSAFLKAFNGSTVEEKAIGKRMLGFKLFHTSMAAGLLGMPLMNLAALVFSAIGGDDEPKDIEASLRQAIGNKPLSDLLLHGPLASLGFDMSSKLGDDKIFSIAPYTTFDFTSAKGAVNTIAGVAGGPALSQVGRMASGVGYIKDGELYKGVERLMPKGLESAMQSFRMANEGFTLKNGDVMVKPEDISAFALTLNAFGLPATEIKSMQWLSHHQQEIGQFYSDHSKALQHQYRDAFKEHDTEKMAELRQAWMDLQKGKGEMRQWFNGRPDELKRQPLTDLVAYPQKAAKREMKHQRSFDADTL